MTSNINIQEIKKITPPIDLIEKYPLLSEDIDFILKSRKEISEILMGKNQKLIVFTGPCSISSYEGAIEYASKIKELENELRKGTIPLDLLIVMRVYYLKPRTKLTTSSWTGFVTDPDLDDTFNINKGLDLGRRLMLEITKMRVPIAFEFLDTITPQYFSDLVSFGVIGARTAESQMHRQLVSGLSMPIGFKNLTDGTSLKAIHGIVSASYAQNFLGIDESGIASHIITRGNPNCCLILRGGEKGPNYFQENIEDVVELLKSEKVENGIIIDCSHGNSCKEYNRQLSVALYVQRLRLLKYPIRGIMLESNLKKGNQKISRNLQYGVSVTDSCIDIETTKILLKLINNYKTQNLNTLIELRHKIENYDEIIYDLLIEPNIQYFEKKWKKSTYLVTSLTPYIFENDAEIFEMCQKQNNEELLNILVSARLSLSEKVAEIKLRSSPFEYLQKSNDFLHLVTNRKIEQDIFDCYRSHPIFLKIMEISKNIQVRYLTRRVNDLKIGYLFGKGSISEEVTQKFYGNFILQPDYYTLLEKLKCCEIDYALIPTYNSHNGNILPINDVTVLGTIDYKVVLSLYSNKEHHKRNEKGKFECDILYVNQYTLKECQKFVEKNIEAGKIINTYSSYQGCVESIRNNGQVCLTISSTNNNSLFLTKLEDNLVKHNVTTFSFCSGVAPPRDALI